VGGKGSTLCRASHSWLAGHCNSVRLGPSRQETRSLISEGAPLPQFSLFKIHEAGQSFFHILSRLQASSLLFLYLITGMVSASGQTASSIPSVGTIVARMAQARAENRARLRPYTVTRGYKLFGKDESKAKSEVIADVAFVPPGSKSYSIQETAGSGLGKMIVRRMLASEADVTKDYTSTDISADNYDFRFVRAEKVNGQRCYVLAAIPRRDDKHLLRGDVWVDANTFLLHRFEGTLAKNPSWWVRDVRVTFIYGQVGGMWLQTASEATANVRIIGHSTMVSRDEKYMIPELVAAGSSAQPIFLKPPVPGRTFRHRVSPN
jgi:Outer membrane lipoprotein-sorting protein